MSDPLKGAIPIEEYVAEVENDPVRKLALQKARRQLAECHYEPGTPTYERLMRGEGPRHMTREERDAVARAAERSQIVIDDDSTDGA